MCFNSAKSLRITVIVISLLLQSPLFAQSLSDDSLLVNRERIKWEALQTKNFGSHREWFAQDFVSIGYLPDAGVYRTGFGDKFVFPTMDELPSATFVLSGFKVVNASPEVKVISYQANGPLNLYVTTVWAMRNKEWKTVFYQATKYK